MAPPPPTRYDDPMGGLVWVTFVHRCHSEGEARGNLLVKPFVSVHGGSEHIFFCFRIVAAYREIATALRPRNDSVFQPVLLTGTRQSTNRVGGGNAARPTMEY